MNDMTFCNGSGCVVKRTCLRFNRQINTISYYFEYHPFNVDRGMFRCDMYICADTGTRGVSLMLEVDS